jgi:serine/threonine protein kinase
VTAEQDPPKNYSDEETVLVGGMAEGPRSIGRYFIKEVLGEGAMGIVYKGYDSSIQRHVAIKTIRREILAADSSGEFIARFKREAQAAGRFVHPNVVTVFEFGDHEGMPYLALEYVAGRELKEVLAEAPLDLDSIWRIFAQVLAGLGVAHSSGVVHRDVKPQNIFVMPNGVTKVGDFGIARIDESGFTRTGTAIGTPSYMPPEQFAGAKIDNRSDLFAACAVLYEMISGKKAFTGTNITDVMYSVLEKDPPDLREINRKIPPALASVVKKGLSKRPEDRFQSAEELSEALEVAFSGGVPNLQTKRSTTFESTDVYTDLVLKSMRVGIRDYHDDILPLIRRQIRGSLDSHACGLIQDAARRSLGYDDLVGLVGSLRISSAQRDDLFSFVQDISQHELVDSDYSLLDSHLGELALTRRSKGLNS